MMAAIGYSPNFAVKHFRISAFSAPMKDMCNHKNFRYKGFFSYRSSCFFGAVRFPHVCGNRFKMRDERS